MNLDLRTRVLRLLRWLHLLEEDPEEILKQSIRDLEDKVPGINENLAMIKAQVTLIEKDLQKLTERDELLTQKIKDALNRDRRDIALNYGTTLEEVRREIHQQEKQLEVTREAWTKAQGVKREFMLAKEQTIQEAKTALSAKRQAAWNKKVIQALDSFKVDCCSASKHERIVRQFTREAADAAVQLQAAFDTYDSDKLDLAGMRTVLDGLKGQVGALEEQLGWRPWRLDRQPCPARSVRARLLP